MSNNNTQCVQEFSAYYANITNIVDFWFVVTVLPIGVVANFMSIFIFTRKALFDKTMMGFYYTNIAVWNLWTILYQMFVMEYQNLFGLDVYAISDAGCKIIYLLRRSRHMSGYVECMLTLDRFFDVYYPNRFRRIIKNKKLVFGFILFIYLVLNIISIENLFYYIQYTYSNMTIGNRTVLIMSKKCTATRAISTASDLITTLLRVHVPFIIMFTLNMLISRKLFKIKGNVNAHIKRPDARRKLEYQFTRTVLLQNFTFLAFNLPLSIIYIMKIAYSYILTTPTQTSVLIQFAYDMAYMLATLFYISLLFVSFALNKLFRHELLIILGLRARHETSSLN